MKSPEEIAKVLIKNKITVENYQKLQDRRKTRLEFWEKEKLKPLIEKERELVEFGEKVLALLKIG